MLFWILFVALLAGCVALALILVDARYRFHWERLSLEARLRRATDGASALRAILRRLRADQASGKLVLNDDYAKLFERLTHDASAE
ncbi:MAG: hypothetical protein HZB16_12135 [Armatimonadetes bacterium]|nr:hypothetical protein [Armatimonadota bacterium]